MDKDVLSLFCFDKTESLRLIKPSMSLAGVESTVILPAETSHFLMSAEERLSQGISDNLIRFSAGIESRKDLEGDLEQAFTAVMKGVER